ncbi:MAG: hypothetical protein DME79_09875 [Verrucomicrobia bacterium]|nr:MAG: hypothetical protein DME79_09875 [Verrucomicrobiota bacterium]
MNSFRKQVGVPALVAVLLGAASLGIDGKFGPQPLVWNFKYGAVIIHVPWLLALLLISAGATFLAKRAGASLSQRVLVTLNLLRAIIITAASRSGQRIHPVDFIGHMLVGWLLIPTGAGLLGALPFLRGHSLGS